MTLDKEWFPDLRSKRFRHRQGLGADVKIAQGYAAPLRALGDDAATGLNIDVLDCDVAWELGFTLETVAHHRWVRVTPPAPEFRVVTRATGSINEVESGVLLVDLSQGAWHAVVRENDDGLAIRWTDDGIEVIELLTIGEPPTSPSLESPILEWSEPLMGRDPWLLEEIDRRLGTGGGWDHAVALGMLLRHRPAENAAAVVAAYFENNTAPSRQEADWYAAQDGHIREWVVSAARFAASEIATGLAVWRESADEDSLLDLAVRREELEGVLQLMPASDRATLQKYVDYVDSVGKVVTSGSSATFDDEQLCRAGAVSPESWWGALFEPDGEFPD